MTNRAFGVEIECGFIGELGPPEVSHRLERAKLHGWSVGYDGTYVEARTPILVGEEGLATLKAGMDLFLHMDGYCTDQDGLHVHHNAPEFVSDMSAIVRLVRSWHANQYVIDAMVDPSRVGNYDSCPPWSEEEIDDLVNEQTIADFSRNSLNIASLAGKGTIEIRQHEGTLDYDEAEAWILFGQTFIEDVLASHTPTPELGSTDKLLEHIRLGEKSGAFLRAKAARNQGGMFS